MKAHKSVPIFMVLMLFGCTAAMAQAPSSEADNDALHLPPFIKPLPPDAPKPAADPKDLRGMWMQLHAKSDQLKTLDGAAPPYSTDAAAKLHARMEATSIGKPFINPAALCRAPGFIWDFGISNFPIRILQDKQQVIVLFERFHAVWRIGLNSVNGSKAAQSKPSYMGQSVGHWDGNTLVVETTDLRDGLWLDESGSFISDAAHITSRITKNAQRSQLEIIHTIDDPKAYTKPWVTRQRIEWRPDYPVLAEHDCEETAGSIEDAKEYGYRPE